MSDALSAELSVYIHIDFYMMLFMNYLPRIKSSPIVVNVVNVVNFVIEMDSTIGSSKVVTVAATPGPGPDQPIDVSYTEVKVIGNGSFGVVYQARLCDTNELVAIKKVLQDKRFKVRWKLILVACYSFLQICTFWLLSLR